MFAGRVVKVVKFATDVTAEKLRNANFEAQISAISKSQGCDFFLSFASFVSNDCCPVFFFRRR